MTHAIQQVRDWQRYIRDNVLTVRQEQNFPDIDQPRGRVIIGRDASLFANLNGKIKKKARDTWRDMKTSELPVSTFDDLVSSVMALADQIEIVERQNESTGTSDG